MKQYPTYPIANPPELPGIYLLKNIKKGLYYIGQAKDLRRRLFEWRGVLANKQGKANARIYEIITDSEVEDWVFEIVQVVEPDQVKTLDALEIQAIQFIKNVKPEQLLNHKHATSAEAVGQAAVQLSEVLDENGKRMYYAEIALRLGVQKKTVAHRLADLREKGIFKMKITDLMR